MKQCFSISQSKQQTCQVSTSNFAAANKRQLCQAVATRRGHLHRSVRTLKSVVTSRLSLAALVRSVQRRGAAAGVDRSHAEVSEARLVRVCRCRRIAVLFRVNRSLVSRIWIGVHIRVTTVAIRWTRWTVVVVNWWFGGIRWPVIRATSTRLGRPVL